MLHLEFMNGEGTNSGVFLYASDTGNWGDRLDLLQKGKIGFQCKHGGARFRVRAARPIRLL